MFVDTHTHIYLQDFDSDRPQLIADAAGRKIEKFLLPNINAATLNKVYTTVESFKECYAMLGLHPCDVNASYEQELTLIEAELLRHQHLGFEQSKICGIGEIGLDYYWDLTFKAQQTTALKTQLLWSRKFNLPVSLHTRNATADVIKLVEEVNNLNMPDAKASKVKGVFHCFGGNLNEAIQVTDLDMYIGIGGVLTFKNAGLDKLVEQLPLNRLVLETDAPYLAPVPFRSKRNVPEYLFFIAEKLAQIKNVSLQEVEKMTTENAFRIFNLS